MHRYVSLDEAHWAHHELIERFGGEPGLRDAAALQAALLRPQTGYYAGLLDEAAALMESLAMNHPFVDGNKRVAVFVTYAFLRMNGLRLDLDQKQAFAHVIALFEEGRFRRQYCVRGSSTTPIPPRTADATARLARYTAQTAPRGGSRCRRARPSRK